MVRLECSLTAAVVDTDMNRSVGGVEAAGFEDHGQHFMFLLGICRVLTFDSLTPGELQRMARQPGSKVLKGELHRA